jgi:succinate dehydrogenase/fumarate reductase flavoprotein subunit
MDGDTALCEAGHSLGEFFHLVSIGVDFPHNRYGEFAGYKTDHDPAQRASSIGPSTSKKMTEALEKELKKKRETGKTGKAELAREMVDLAINDRDVTAIKYVMDRIDGKPKETVDMAAIAEINTNDEITRMSPEEQMQRITELVGKLGFYRGAE